MNCEYCNSAKPLYYAEDRGLTACIDIFRKSLIIDLYEDYVELQINYCPHCGQRIDWSE